jgi:hypothetical protein
MTNLCLGVKSIGALSPSIAYCWQQKIASLGAIYNTTGNLDATLEEYRDAISYAEADGNLYLPQLSYLRWFERWQ